MSRKVYFSNRRAIIIFTFALIMTISACGSRKDDTVKVTSMSETAEQISKISTQSVNSEIDATEGMNESDNATKSEENSTVAYDDETESDYIFPDSYYTVINPMDIGTRSVEELRLGRNEIYARHGRKFTSPDLQAYFDSQDWYKGTIEAERFNESILSKIERDNVRILKLIEDIPALPSVNGPRKYQFYFYAWSTGDIEFSDEFNGMTVTLTPMGDGMIFKTKDPQHDDESATYVSDGVYYKMDEQYWQKEEMTVDDNPMSFDDAKLIYGGASGDGMLVFKRIE